MSRVSRSRRAMFALPHKKARQEALEGSLARLQQGAKIEECLAAYPAHAAHLRPLLATARMMQALASAAPSPQAKAFGKAQLQQAIQARLAAQPAAPAGAPTEAELEHVLNTCLERMRLGETMERCLTDYPSFAAALRPLLSVAIATRSIAGAQPRPEAKALGKARLQAAINAKLAQAAAANTAPEAEFDTILNTCLERLGKGATVEACLASYPRHAERLRPLLQTALAAQATYRVKPDQKAKAAGRAKLRQSAAHGSGGGIWRIPTALMPLRAWGASAAVLVILFGGYGVVHASGDAKPRGVLYPVKRTVEDLQERAPFRSDDSKAKLAAQFAERRTEEIAYLAERGESAKIPALTEDLNRQVERFAHFETKGAQKEVQRLQARIESRLPQESASLPIAAGEPPAAPPAATRPAIAAGETPAATPRATRPAAAATPEPTRVPPTREQTRPPIATDGPRPPLVLSEGEAKKIDAQRQNLEQNKARLTEQYQKTVAKLEEAKKMAPPEQAARFDETLATLEARHNNEIAKLDEGLSKLAALESNPSIVRPQTPSPTPGVTRPALQTPATRPPTRIPETRPATRPVETKAPTQVPATRPIETKPPTQVPATRPATLPPTRVPETRPAETKPPTRIPETRPATQPASLTVPPTRVLETRPATQPPTLPPTLPSTRPPETRPPTQPPTSTPPPTRPPTEPPKTPTPAPTKPPDSTPPPTSAARTPVSLETPAGATSELRTSAPQTQQPTQPPTRRPEETRPPTRAPTQAPTRRPEETRPPTQPPPTRQPEPTRPAPTAAGNQGNPNRQPEPTSARR